VSVACTLVAACIPSNVVAAEEREVAPAVETLAFTEPMPQVLSGLYESVSIDGDIAASMWKVYYHFAPGGDFSGAALVLVDGQPQFQTLSGRYRIGDDRISLGEDNEPALLAAAKDHLRITSSDGSIVLRRVGD